MSDSQGNGSVRHELPRYANGKQVPMDELDMIAKAFGFHSARHMDEVCAHRDAQRAHRRAASKVRPAVVKKAS